jgi:hypothetical protein
MAATIEIRDDETLATLVTIARMAHLANNSTMERNAQKRLRDKYGVRLDFDPQPQTNNRKVGR